MKVSNTHLASLLTGVILLPSASKHLYLDPSSGSFILQVLIAGAAGFLFIMRNQIARLFGIFSRGKKSVKKSTARKVRSRNAK